MRTTDGTREQVAAMQAKAIRFAEDVLQDTDLADEFGRAFNGGVPQREERPYRAKPNRERKPNATTHACSFTKRKQSTPNVRTFPSKAPAAIIP